MTATPTPVYRREELLDVARNLAIQFNSQLREDIARARKSVALVISILSPSAAAYVAARALRYLQEHYGETTSTKFMEALEMSR